MSTISTKPVKECLHCALNLGKQCAIFENPELKWKRRKCEGFNNPEYIEIYERMQKPEGAYARKRDRARRAKVAHTEDHHNGLHVLGR